MVLRLIPYGITGGCDQRLADQREYIDSLKRDKKMLGVAVAVLTTIIIIILAISVAF